MAFVFGTRSKNCLATVDLRLKRIAHRALGYNIMDFTVICGHRTQKAQDEAVATGASKVRWPNSQHNSNPSLAMDVAPWPIDWHDSLAFARLAGILEAAAAEEGVRLRWGGDWDRDGSSRDQSFMDIGHVEIHE